MNTQITFTYKDSCLLSTQELEAVATQLKPELERIATAVGSGYDSDYASINLPYDAALLATVERVIAEKKQLNPTMLVVVGIGGSNLGTAAVQQALYGSFYNQQNPETSIYFADTIDEDHLADIIKLMESQLARKHKVLLNVISKSGSTTETIANFELLFAIVKKYVVDPHECVVVTTDAQSPLWHLAQRENFTCLEIPKKVGGRYSVFSAVGLFPLGFIGIDIGQLLAGARAALKQMSVQAAFFDNPAAVSAAILYTHAQRGKTIHDSFLFSVDFENLGKWYRQLMAESLGKEYDRMGKQMYTGITPTVSIGTTDLHSVAQLYLGGPYDKMSSLITLDRMNSQLAVPNYPAYDALVGHIQGVPFAHIMDAIVQGVQRAYNVGNRPYVRWQLSEKSAWCLGQLLQYKMGEIMYLGFLLGINPFDQPNVESYKQETRKILAHD